MPRELNFKDKLSQFKEWMPSIMECIKKDIRNEHLKKDNAFVKKYLNGKNIHKLNSNELAQAYTQAIDEQENGEELAEFIAHRWIFRNSEMYHFFETHLCKIN